MATTLFDERLLPTDIMVRDGYRVRSLRSDDYDYLNLWRKTEIPKIKAVPEFQKRFEAMKKTNSYFVVVVEQISSQKIVSALTLLLEFKFIHEAGQRGRIENFVLADSHCAFSLCIGSTLHSTLIELAKTLGAYKLSCQCDTGSMRYFTAHQYVNIHHFLDQRFETKAPAKWSNPQDAALLFNENLIPTGGIPEGIRARALRSPDDMDQYLKLLEQLTSVGYLSKNDFEQRFATMKTAESYFIVILEDIASSKIIGAASLVTETKYNLNCELRGRVEDVVVDESQRGKKLGVLLNKILVEMAKKLGVFKLSLECKTELIPFYEKFGYKESLKFMAQRFDNVVPPVVTTLD
uniref:glucosamine-phosphate N-acetyltransferase n=1 Tax=Caenorhabditis tropicalis TaxID=1561998 RepID=A0A1I7U3N9_9PELO